MAPPPRHYLFKGLPPLKIYSGIRVHFEFWKEHSSVKVSHHNMDTKVLLNFSLAGKLSDIFEFLTTAKTSMNVFCMFCLNVNINFQRVKCCMVIEFMILIQAAKLFLAISKIN